MTSRRVLCMLICVFSISCCVSSLNRGVKHVFSIQELTVTGENLMHCGNQKNMCVMDGIDCISTVSDRTLNVSRSLENFVNTSCHYLLHEMSFTCRWIQLNKYKTGIINTFIISRAKNIIDCPSILNFYSSFNLTIKSKNVFNQNEIFSAVYTVKLREIIQAPRPVVTSVNTTDTSLTITWTSGKRTIEKCLIRYKRFNESWTETEVFTPSVEFLFVINGLQPFTEYSLSVSCVHELGRWSDWSAETRVKTSESRPTAPPAVSYYVSSDKNSRTRQLWLLWKALDITDARGLIRGYEVSYAPIRQPSIRRVVNTSDLKTVVLIMAEVYDVTVAAYNSAGQSPYRQIRVHADLPQDVLAMKGLWVYSEGPSLRLYWEHELTTINVSEFAIEWCSTENNNTSHWKRVSGSTFTTILTGIRPDEIYNISVYAVSDTLCGRPTSISANLQHGTLLDLVRFRLVNVTKSSVSVQWVWQETKLSINVLQYRLVLKGKHETHSLQIFPNTQQHSFYNLQANTRYSVFIHGETTTGNFSKASLDVNTPLLDYDEIIKLAVPVVFLVLSSGIFLILTRTVCKEYFFPNIANPSYSLIGRWLLNPHYEGNGNICVLQLDTFFVVDQQMEKIHVEHHMSVASDDEDLIPSKIFSTCKGTTQTLWKSNSDYLESTQRPSSVPEYIDLPIIPANLDYVQNGQNPG
ncbi:interleukin-6 receptor subunit beta-like isoform X2 [Myxocyprinus asiaticus]|uniref:interleukin-6 receptor subunit beta-like isoform X2 n=1 Tax=Myxocyprinus asiaticus TaxID=70543 RepID=UPI0022221FA5|nr:interleukin-6 receptor subunit beta-like isoform X2 [Myxocyprinus asiaticus]